MIVEKLERLREHFGSYTKIALALDITPQAINEWKVRGKIPPVSALKVERITEGKIKAIELVD
jgi:DNA-binding transcriptional regulator YdaS (Cro superfamily)